MEMFSKSGSFFGSDGKSKARCYESHPTLKIGKGRLYGGSASWPMKKADIYVALQAGSSASSASDPWDPQTVVEIQYSIRDMGIPTNVPRFLKMIEWLCTQLQNGRKVHVGCLGGHGRTGLVISAIVAQALKKKNAIQWVREHYCEKAVESSEQVAFLQEHFHVSKVAGAKEHKKFVGKATFVNVGGYPGDKEAHEYLGTLDKAFGQFTTEGPVLRKNKVLEPQRLLPEMAAGDAKVIAPMASARSLWKPAQKRDA